MSDSDERYDSDDATTVPVLSHVASSAATAASGDEWVTCSSCGGSGRRKDMTWW